MDLSDVYSRQVKKSPLAGLRGSFGMPPIEKDPIINQLEIDVFAKMHELDKIDHPTYEDALKEIIEIKNKNKYK